MGKVVAEVSIVPVGTGSPSVSDYVKEAIKVIDDSGIEYMLCPMGTVMQGELEDILSLIGDLHQHMNSMGVKRLVTRLVIDERSDKELSMGGKLESIESITEKDIFARKAQTSGSGLEGKEQ